MFIEQLIDELVKTRVKPSRAYGDNQGCLFLANNISVGQRTKHIDIRTKFVNQRVDDGELVTQYVRSEDNSCDVLTKNVKEDLHVKHAVAIYSGRLHWIVLQDASMEGVKRYAGSVYFGLTVCQSAVHAACVCSRLESERGESDHMIGSMSVNTDGGGGGYTLVGPHGKRKERVPRLAMYKTPKVMTASKALPGGRFPQRSVRQRKNEDGVGFVRGISKRVAMARGEEQKEKKAI
jgi:hypothetical protein